MTMPATHRLCLFTLVALLGAPLALAQTTLVFGGGEGRAATATQCLTQADRAAIEARLTASSAALRAAGRLSSVRSGGVTLTLPVQADPSVETNGFYGISNFVDQNAAAPGRIQDFNCGARTYDTPSGYNHQGIDYFSFPYGWTLMDEDKVNVVAAAAGTIIGKDDGNQDRSCSFNGSAWNAVYVEHDDGSVAWYGHLKRNALTPKGVGERVEAGEFLGVMGSSGNSTSPHLHIELYDADGNLVEPNAGPCNGLNAASWWAEQRLYYEPQIAALMSHATPPDAFPACPTTTDDPARQDRFDDGDRVFLAAYFRDQLDTAVTDFTLLDPSGAEASTWNFRSNAPHYAAAYWYWTFDITPAWTRGTWTWRVEHEGEIAEHQFEVGVVVSTEEEIVASAVLSQAFPNPTVATAQWTLRLGAPQQVRAVLFDVLGRRIATVHEGTLAAGTSTLQAAEALPPGAYVLQVTGDTFAATRQLTVLR